VPFADVGVILGVVCPETEDGDGVLGEDYDHVAVGGEGIDVELFEVREGAVVGDEFVDGVQSGIDEFELEFIDRAVGLLGGQGGHLVEEGVELLFEFFEFPDVFFGVHGCYCKAQLQIPLGAIGFAERIQLLRSGRQG